MYTIRMKYTTHIPMAININVYDIQFKLFEIKYYAACKQTQQYETDTAV